MLLGRDAELRLLDSLLDGARAGHSHALVLRGDPGVGKTALLDAAGSRADGMQVLRAGESSWRQISPSPDCTRCYNRSPDSFLACHHGSKRH